MAYTSLTYHKAERIGILTFIRPERMNSITEVLLTELASVLLEVEADADLGALIVTGGKANAFSVGLDLALLDRAFCDLPYFEAVVRSLNNLVTRLDALTIPTIAAVNGFARAGGFALAMGCDFMIVADEAMIGDVHTNAGGLPAAYSLRLKQRIGEQRAKDLIWAARWLAGRQAVDYGLALKSVPRAQLQAEALTLAGELATVPRACLASSKDVFRRTAGLNLADGAELEIEALFRYMSTEPYAKEGYAAYREGRLPSWKLT